MSLADLSRRSFLGATVTPLLAPHVAFGAPPPAGVHICR